MTEAEYLGQVYDICKDAGAKAHHCGDGRACCGAGFPDLVIMGVHGILYREVKASPNDRKSPEQTAVLWLLKASGADAAVWTSEDLLTGKVAEEIRRIA